MNPDKHSIHTGAVHPTAPAHQTARAHGATQPRTVDTESTVVRIRTPKPRALPILALAFTLALPFGVGAQDAAGTTAATTTSDGTAPTTALDRDAFMAAALAGSPDLAAGIRSLEAARAKALGSLAIWNSSLKVDGATSGTLAGTSTQGGGSAGSTDPTWGVGLTIKPIEQVGLSASIDQDQTIVAGISVSPFASTASRDTAWQAWEDEILKAAETRTTVRQTLLKLYAAWAGSVSSRTQATLDKDIKAVLLAAEEIRYQAGAGSTTTLDEARSTHLTAVKTELEAIVTESSARADLLVAAGLPQDTILAEPTDPATTELQERATTILAESTAPHRGSDLILAERAYDRAKATAGSLPGFLSGLDLGATLTSTTAHTTWKASASYSLTADAFSGNEQAERDRALATAKAALDKTRAQASLDTTLAHARLRAALTWVDVTISQYTQRTVEYESATIKAAAGNLSPTGLEQARLAAIKAKATLHAALWDLEATLLSWD